LIDQGLAMIIRTLCGAAAALALLPAGRALAAPVEFYCHAPWVILTADPARSRDRLQQSEEVFVLQVALNTDAPDGDVAVTPNADGVCDIHLPVGAYFTQNPSWRESAAPGSDHAAFQALRLRGTDAANSNASHIVIKMGDATKTGIATVEFHLNFMYPRTAF
jgi:hypothetical protein